MYIAYSTNLACALTSASVAGSRPARQQPPSHRVVELASAQLSRYTICTTATNRMGDNIFLGDRNGIRTPCSGTRTATQVSQSATRQLYFHCHGSIYGYSHQCGSSTQRSVELLHWTRNMIALRKLFQVFGRGTLVLEPANRKILATARPQARRWLARDVLCVANLSRFAQPSPRPRRPQRAELSRCWVCAIPTITKPLRLSSLRTPSSGSNSSPECEPA